MKGLGLSPGVAIGPARVQVEAVFRARETTTPTASQTNPEKEKLRFHKALEVSLSDVRSICEKVREDNPKEAAILEVQEMFLQDPDMVARTEKNLAKGLSAEAAVRECSDFYLSKIAKSKSARNAPDVRDVVSRVLHNLDGSLYHASDENGIIVARELAPSLAATLSAGSIKGWVTEHGGETDHAQAQDLPAVSGIPGLLIHVSDGDLIVIDGTEGVIITNPTEETLAFYKQRLAVQEAEKRELLAFASKKAQTKDGKEITLLANIAIPAGAKAAFKGGAEGIGLYRTEYLYLNQRELPSEEEQFEAYSQVVRAAAGKPVTIRTMDLGGDKATILFGKQHESNPFLGWRALRICLDQPDVFRTQLRAILRAANYGQVRIMFPMVTTVEEFRHAKSLLLEAKAELTARGEKVPEYIPCGMMVEIPAAALMAEHFAPFVDFFSIGTNDLTQYTMAADRSNDKVAKLYDAIAPSVLRLVDLTVRAAKGAPKPIPVCSCGKAAGRPEAALLFLGLGVNELSMPVKAQGKMKKALLSFDFAECENAARGIITAPNFETYKQRRAEWLARFQKQDE